MGSILASGVLAAVVAAASAWTQFRYSMGWCCGCNYEMVQPFAAAIERVLLPLIAIHSPYFEDAIPELVGRSSWSAAVAGQVALFIAITAARGALTRSRRWRALRRAAWLRYARWGVVAFGSIIAVLVYVVLAMWMDPPAELGFLVATVGAVATFVLAFPGLLALVLPAFVGIEPGRLGCAVAAFVVVAFWFEVALDVRTRVQARSSRVLLGAR